MKIFIKTLLFSCLTVTSATFSSDTNQSGINDPAIDSLEVDSPDTDSLVLSGLMAQFDSYSASFYQVVEEEDGFVLDENSGVMSFEKPNKLFWQVLEPFANLLVSDGTDVYFYDPDLNQVTVRSWSSDPAQNPMAVFLSVGNLTNYYQIEQTQTEGQANQAFSLTPLDPNSTFSAVQLEFKQDVPVAMTFADQIGQITRIHFSEVDSAQLPDQPYEFTLPATADVIDDR